MSRIPSRKLARTFSGVPATGLAYGVEKDLGRHLVAQRFQDVEFLPPRQPGTGQLGALEVAVDPLILTEEELPVHLLEIEGKIERASNPCILKLVASRVEGECPHDPPVALGEFG